MTITFENTGDTFSALRAAEAWLKQHGYSWGSLCCPQPTAIKHGDWAIAKWKNLTAKERQDVDGTMSSQDARQGTVTITLKRTPHL